MPDVSVAFHALSEEAPGLFAAALGDLDVHRAGEHLFPDYRVGGWDDEPPPRRLSVSLRRFDVGARSTQDFLARNPDALVLLVGQHTAAGLRESVLSARTDDPAAIAAWRQVARRLRASLHRGVHVGQGEHRRPVPGHGYTEAVAEAVAEGLVLLGVAGDTRLELE